MSSVSDRILSASAQNARLLTVLRETDYAASALVQNTSYIGSLQQQVKQTEHILSTKRFATSLEKSDHERYQRSVVKRFMKKITGQREEFEAKEAKEEKEYLDALHEEQKTKYSLDLLQTSLNDATRMSGELQEAKTRHDQAQQELNTLYASIFDGPTPEFPEEDVKEDPVRMAQMEYNLAQSQHMPEKLALDILIDANKYLQRAIEDVRQAEDASELDIWGLGGPGADFMERSALSRAQSLASQVEMLLSQAKRTSPAVNVESIGTMRIAQGNMFGDIIFDNIFSDLDFHGKIQDSENNLLGIKRNLLVQINLAKQREEEARRRLDSVAGRLDAARQELQRVRQEMFERVLSRGNAVPPAYV